MTGKAVMINGSIKIEHGSWLVERNCCTSGNCISCNKKAPFGTPVRVIQMYKLSESTAKEVAGRWSDYKAVARLGTVEEVVEAHHDGGCQKCFDIGCHVCAHCQNIRPTIKK